MVCCVFVFVLIYSTIVYFSVLYSCVVCCRVGVFIGRRVRSLWARFELPPVPAGVSVFRYWPLVGRQAKALPPQAVSKSVPLLRCLVVVSSCKHSAWWPTFGRPHTVVLLPPTLLPHRPFLRVRGDTHEAIGRMDVCPHSSAYYINPPLPLCGFCVVSLVCLVS